MTSIGKQIMIKNIVCGWFEGLTDLQGLFDDLLFRDFSVALQHNSSLKGALLTQNILQQLCVQPIGKKNNNKLREREKEKQQ
jgi:hypothetical protein